MVITDLEKLKDYYGVLYIYSSYSVVDRLFSNTDLDPVIMADDNASIVSVDRRGLPLPFEISVGIGNGVVVTQILVFKNSGSHALYLADGVTIFDPNL